MLMGTTGSCSNCESATTFRRFQDATPWLPDRDQPLRCSACHSSYEESCVITGRYQNRGVRVSDGYVTGVEAFELHGSPTVKSYGERQRLREAQGLDPDTGQFRDYGDGGEKYN